MVIEPDMREVFTGFTTPPLLVKNLGDTNADAYIKKQQYVSLF